MEMGNADALREVTSMAGAAHAPFFLLAWLLRVDVPSLHIKFKFIAFNNISRQLFLHAPCL